MQHHAASGKSRRYPCDHSKDFNDIIEGGAKPECWERTPDNGIGQSSVIVMYLCWKWVLITIKENLNYPKLSNGSVDEVAKCLLNIAYMAILHAYGKQAPVKLCKTYNNFFGFQILPQSKVIIS